MAKFVTRAGDWLCLCGATNFATEGNCANCDSPQAKGTILNPLNMRCRRKRKSKCVKNPIAIKEINGTILQRLRAWTVLNPFGKNVHMDMGTNNWISMLLKAAHNGNGVHIHTTCSKWMFFELNLGTHHTRGSKYLALSNKLRHTLQPVAAQCLEKALDDVAKYTNCDRVICETGAMWKLPCGDAHEICSLIFQPHGSERQAVHKDGHARYAKPDYPNDVFPITFLMSLCLCKVTYRRYVVALTGVWGSVRLVTKMKSVYSMEGCGMRAMLTIPGKEYGNFFLG